MQERAQLDDPFVGRVFAERYLIEACIGEGATGRVYRAKNERLGNDVALKVLHENRLSDEALADRFRGEAKAASQLNHPNCVQVIDFGEDEEGNLFSCMELVRGRPLSALIAEASPLRLETIVNILAQVADALSAAEGLGLVHRDLKPENIMIREGAGEVLVKVLDFSAEDSEASRRVFGTAEYMSPEQARNERLDGRSDIYSVGVILFEMLTGQLPFQGESALATAAMHINEPAPAPSSRVPEADIHYGLDELTLKCLAKRREERPQSATELRQELLALMPNELFVSANRYGALHAVERPVRERKKLLILAIVLAALVSLVLVFLLLFLEPSDPPKPADEQGEAQHNKAVDTSSGNDDRSPEMAAKKDQDSLQAGAEGANDVGLPKEPAVTEHADGAAAPIADSAHNAQPNPTAEVSGDTPEVAPAEPTKEEASVEKKKTKPKRHRSEPITARIIKEAQKAYDGGDYKLALSHIKRALKRSPKDSNALSLEKKIKAKL